MPAPPWRPSPSTGSSARLARAGRGRRSGGGSDPSRRGHFGGNLCQDTRCIFYNQASGGAPAAAASSTRATRCHVIVKNDRCYATYHGDVAPALMVLGARVEIAGPRAGAASRWRNCSAKTGGTPEPRARRTGRGVGGSPRQRLETRLRQARIRDAGRFSARGVAVALRRDGDRIAGLKVAITGTNSARCVPTDELVGGRWDAAAAETLSCWCADSNVLKTTVTGVGYRRRALLALAPRTSTALWQEAESQRPGVSVRPRSLPAR